MNCVTQRTISVINFETLSEENRLKLKRLVRKYMRQMGLGNHHFKKTMFQLEQSMAFVLGDNEGYVGTQPIDGGLVVTQYYNLTIQDLDSICQMAKEAGFNNVIFQAHIDMELPGWKKGPTIWSRSL